MVGEQLAGISLGLDGVSLRGGRKLVVQCWQCVYAVMPGQWVVEDGWKCVWRKSGGLQMKLMHAHPVKQGGSEEQATTLSTHPALIPGPRPQSFQPRKMEVVAKASQPALVRLSSSSSALRN